MGKQKVNKAFVEKFVGDKGYPEVGTFSDKKDLQKFYKHLSDEQLDDWISLEGIESEVKPTDSPQILRMRKCMAILYKHFPKQPSGKKKSKYADYSNEQLLQMAIDKDVEVDVCDDERILRMRTIMALREAGVLE